jgi:hypothetical protein
MRTTCTKTIFEELAVTEFEKNYVLFETRGTIIVFPNGPFLALTPISWSTSPK